MWWWRPQHRVQRQDRHGEGRTHAALFCYQSPGAGRLHRHQTDHKLAQQSTCRVQIPFTCTRNGTFSCQVQAYFPNPQVDTYTLYCRYWLILDPRCYHCTVCLQKSPATLEIIEERMVQSRKVLTSASERWVGCVFVCVWLYAQIWS